MIVKLTTVQAKSAVRKYADRQKTIRQLAIEYDVTYEQMRKIMVKAGYSNGLKVRCAIAYKACPYYLTLWL